MAKEDNKESKRSEESKDQTYKGEVIVGFKIGSKEFKKEDSFTTKDKFTYNHLKNNHKIK